MASTKRVLDIKLGLTRMNSLLTCLGSPQMNFPIVHVTGTNGKGSTCSYISHVFQSSGLKTGQYNSPHFLEVRDSIKVNGISPFTAQFNETMAYVEGVNDEKYIGCTLFELLTCFAILWFSNQKVDVAVIEVGVGGRLDATNVFPATNVLCSVITSIGVDHLGLLGKTIEDIAWHKVAIMKTNRLCIVGPQVEIVKNIVIKQGEDLGCHVVWSPRARWSERGKPYSLIPLCSSLDTKDVGGSELEVKLPLLGDFQLENVGIAATALSLLQKRYPHLNISVNTIKSGIESTVWPGRLEWVSISKFPVKILIDGAHNVASAKELRSYLDNDVLPGRLRKSIIWIMGFSCGKDIEGLLKELIREGDHVVVTTFSQPQGMPWVNHESIDHVVRTVNRVMDKKVNVVGCENLENALSEVLRHSGMDLVVLSGSLYLVADLYRNFLSKECTNG